MGWDAVSTSSAGADTDRSIRLRRGAKAFVSTGEHVLLVKERHHDGDPFWTLPGGGMESGESPAAALRRELREELDCQVFVGTPAATLWYAHRSAAQAVTAYRVYECAVVSQPTPNAAEGVLEARWVRADRLPPRTLPQIRLLCA